MPEGDNYKTTQKDRVARSLDDREFKQAKKAGDDASAAEAREKFQGFTAGSVAPAKAADPNAPKRESFPAGLGGEGAYQKAKREYEQSKQAAALKKSSE